MSRNCRQFLVVGTTEKVEMNRISSPVEEEGATIGCCRHHVRVAETAIMPINLYCFAKCVPKESADQSHSIEILHRDRYRSTDEPLLVHVYDFLKKLSPGVFYSVTLIHPYDLAGNFGLMAAFFALYKAVRGTAKGDGKERISFKNGRKIVEYAEDAVSSGVLDINELSTMMRNSICKKCFFTFGPQNESVVMNSMLGEVHPIFVKTNLHAPRRNFSMPFRTNVSERLSRGFTAFVHMAQNEYEKVERSVDSELQRVLRDYRELNDPLVAEGHIKRQMGRVLEQVTSVFAYDSQEDGALLFINAKAKKEDVEKILKEVAGKLFTETRGNLAMMQGYRIFEALPITMDHEDIQTEDMLITFLTCK